MDFTLKDSSPSYSMVKQWVSEFKKGRTSTFDELRSERPVKVATPEMIEKMHKRVIEDRRLMVSQKSKATRMSTEHVRNISHEHSGTEKQIEVGIVPPSTMFTKFGPYRLSSVP
ncbi:protein GVQW3-like [Belonocnema kinseyi]|uniref:protein GVQW3-like n=1 Tax=Belonocnema kinseyi TaxID=2817044 RepID=UPI00143D700A|nr:protein GVQW3-like [Belonocnema kinseyi]